MLRSSKQYRGNIVGALVLVLGLLVATTNLQSQSFGNPDVIPPNARPYGLTYGQWSAKWWAWSLALAIPGHPFLGCPVPVDAGQSGPVWFLAGVVTGTAACDITVPAGKALFFPIANSECSSLEDPPFFGATAEDQRTCAQNFGNQIDVNDLFCEIDGVSVKNLNRYRFVSPQFTFFAPTPWIFAAVGGTGTSVGDGYYLLLSPLSRGSHTIHVRYLPFGVDTTYHLTVGP